MYVGASRTLKEKPNLNNCLFLRHGYTGSGSPNTGVVSAVYAFGCQPMATTQRPHDDLEAQTVDVEELEARVDALSKGLAAARESDDELKDDLRRLQEENDELREEIERLDARTDLLKLVDNSDDMTGQQRSITLIQNLHRAALKERDRGRSAKASVNREEAETALQHPDVDRTTTYDDMRRAVRLVGDEQLLKYSTATGGESRLKLNLEAGNLPNEIVGQNKDGVR